MMVKNVLKNCSFAALGAPVDSYPLHLLHGHSAK